MANEETVQELKELNERLLHLFDVMDDDGYGICHLSPDFEPPSRRWVRLEMLRYFVYIWDADGVFDSQFADLFNEFFEIGSYEKVVDLINYYLLSGDVEESTFIKTDLLSIAMAYDHDYDVYDGEEYPSISAVIDVFYTFGKALARIKESAECLVRAKKYAVSLYNQVIDKCGDIIRKEELSVFNDDLDLEFTESPSVEELLEQLNGLIGLENIKNDVKELISLVKMQELRKGQGLKTIPVSLHLVFTGNPGTGKTTVARLLAKLYKAIGVLSKGQLVEVERADLVAGYVGQTALKTQEKIQEALGGVLFIDEAYTLAKEGNDFGQESIDTILKAMEDNRDDFVVIVAGYTDLMQNFINSNPGLKSRFNKYFEFPDYSADELKEIFKGMTREYEYVLTDKATDTVENQIDRLVAEKDDNFANAREIRNMFETAITNQAMRMASHPDDDITVLTEADFL